MHNNIVANTPTRQVDLDHPNYQKYLLFQDISTIPYNDLNEVLDVKNIITALA
jgi:hypothetical protein